MLDPRFQNAQQAFARLQADYRAGRLAPQQFDRAVRDLALEHDGRYWMIGAETGRWFASDGGNWVPATPPEAGTATPAPAVVTPAAASGSGFGQTLGKWGLLLLVMGAGSFVLPMFGLQFRLFSLFGNEAGAGIVAIVIGGVLLLLSLLGGRTSASAPIGELPGAAAAAVTRGGRIGWLIAAAVVAAGLFGWWSNKPSGTATTSQVRPGPQVPSGPQQRAECDPNARQGPAAIGARPRGWCDPPADK